MSKSFKIIAISDTHNLHNRLKVPWGDILIHAGDFTEIGSLEDVRRFNDFLGTLPHKYKIVIAGNHDFSFQRTPDAARSLLTNCIYLEDQAVTVEGIRFYGSPWQPWFYDWAFNLQRGKAIREKWELIPHDTDILITHGPPYGYGDLTLDRYHVGCEDLLNIIETIKPKYHIFGHIHEAAGICSNENTVFINATSCDISVSRISHPPVLFDYFDNVTLSNS